MKIYCLFINIDDYDNPNPMATFVFNSDPSYANLKDHVGRYLKRISINIAEYITYEFYLNYKYDGDSPIHRTLETFISKTAETNETDETDETDETYEEEIDHQTLSIKYLIEKLSIEDVYDFLLGNRKWGCGLKLCDITDTIEEIIT